MRPPRLPYTTVKAVKINPEKIQAWTRFYPRPLRYQHSALPAELLSQLGVSHVVTWNIPVRMVRIQSLNICFIENNGCNNETFVHVFNQRQKAKRNVLNREYNAIQSSENVKKSYVNPRNYKKKWILPSTNYCNQFSFHIFTYLSVQVRFRYRLLKLSYLLRVQWKVPKSLLC